MKPPLPQPEPPPAAPPFGFWTSLAILGVGLALLIYVFVAAWVEPDDPPNHRNPREDDGDRGMDRERGTETSTEHPDDDVV